MADKEKTAEVVVEKKYPVCSIVIEGKKYRVVKQEYKGVPVTYSLEQVSEDRMGKLGWFSPATTSDFNAIVADLFGGK